VPQYNSSHPKPGYTTDIDSNSKTTDFFQEYCKEIGWDDYGLDSFDSG
jgi:hypothetical protein